MRESMTASAPSCVGGRAVVIAVAYTDDRTTGRARGLDVGDRITDEQRVGDRHIEKSTGVASRLRVRFVLRQCVAADERLINRSSAARPAPASTVRSVCW